MTGQRFNISKVEMAQRERAAAKLAEWRAAAAAAAEPANEKPRKRVPTFGKGLHG
jgi:hypothetical protein